MDNEMYVRDTIDSVIDDMDIITNWHRIDKDKWAVRRMKRAVKLLQTLKAVLELNKLD